MDCIMWVVRLSYSIGFVLEHGRNDWPFQNLSQDRSKSSFQRSQEMRQLYVDSELLLNIRSHHHLQWKGNRSDIMEPISRKTYDRSTFVNSSFDSLPSKSLSPWAIVLSTNC
jgi:hypothetical protein